MLKLDKTIDAMIKGKTIETITKKWNKILEATKDNDFINWIESDNLTKLIDVKELWVARDVDWQFDNECYVSLNIYKEVV